VVLSFFFGCLDCCGCERWFDEGDRRWVKDTGVKEGIWVCDEVLILWVVVLMGLWDFDQRRGKMYGFWFS
jgi:hypothetical protein